MSEQAESRTETVGIAVTPSEKELVKLFGIVRKPDGGISNVLRERSLHDLLAEAEVIRAKLDEEFGTLSAPDAGSERAVA